MKSNFKKYLDIVQEVMIGKGTFDNPADLTKQVLRDRKISNTGAFVTDFNKDIKKAADNTIDDIEKITKGRLVKDFTVDNITLQDVELRIRTIRVLNENKIFKAYEFLKDKFTKEKKEMELKNLENLRREYNIKKGMQ